MRRHEGHKKYENEIEDLLKDSPGDKEMTVEVEDDDNVSEGSDMAVEQTTDKR